MIEKSKIKNYNTILIKKYQKDSIDEYDHLTGEEILPSHQDYIFHLRDISSWVRWPVPLATFRVSLPQRNSCLVNQKVNKQTSK